MSRLFRLLLLILAAAGVAQAWLSIEHREGDQRANALVRDPDGCLTVAGRETRPGYWRGDLLLVHTDSLGRELWRRSVGSKRGDEEAHALLALGDTGYLAAGCRYRDERRSKKSITGLVQAFSASDEPTWSHTFDDVEIKAAIRFQDGILLGGCRKKDTDSGWLCLMDARGAVRWTRDLHPADSSRVDALAVLSDSTFVLAGQWKRAAGQRCAAWCAVANATGKLLHECCSGLPDDFFRAAVVRNDVITCAGGSALRRRHGIPVANCFLMQVDAQCQPLDSLRVRSQGLDFIMALAATDSAMVGAGVTALNPDSPGSRPGVLLCSLTPSLEMRWQSPQAGIVAGMGKAVILQPDGFLVAGLARLDPKADADLLLLRATAAGLIESGSADSDPAEGP